MNHSITIRNMQLSDTDRVAHINLASWQRAYSGIVSEDFLSNLNLHEKKQSWKDGFHKYNNLIRLVVLQDDLVIGYACGLDFRSKINESIDSELYAIYVDPNYMHLGFGKKLIQEFKNRLFQKGYTKMGVWVLEDNSKARSFYEKNGGKLCKEIKNTQIGNQVLKEVCYAFELSGE